jgi:curved DNA-binding protein CbpA
MWGVDSSQTHYQVLGLTPEAAPEEIKRRFRELARRHHPDLNPNKPDVHALFLRINQAHETLSDPNLRAAYDLGLRDQARREAEARARGGSRAASAARPTAGARPGTPSGGAAGDVRAERLAAEQRRTAARHMDAARYAFARGNLREADRLCRESLRFGRTGPAHEMLGDIYSRQGRADKALQHYTVAAQLTPNSGLIMAKLQRVTEKLGPRAAKASQQRATSTSTSGTRRPGGAAAQPRQAAMMRSLFRLFHRSIVTSLGILTVLFLLLIWRTLGETKPDWPLITEMPLAQLTCMALAGFFGGVTLSAGAWVRRFQDEMVISAGNPPRVLPLGIVMGLFGSVGMPFAFVVYGVIAYFQSYVSTSILGLFAAATLLAVGFATVAPEKAMFQTLFAGGNIVFVCMLIGWWFGEVLRPGWSA